MERAEYWLLDVAIQGLIPIGMIATRSDVETHLLREHHGLNMRELTRLMMRLFDRGDLLALRSNEDEPFTPDREEVRQNLNRGWSIEFFWFATFFGLTEAGGARWEALSDPDWSCFVDASFIVDPQVCEIATMEKELAEEILERCHYDAGTLEEEVLEPWAPTYWKELPRGYRLMFAYEEPIPDIPEEDEWYTPFYSFELPYESGGDEESDEPEASDENDSA